MKNSSAAMKRTQEIRAFFNKLLKVYEEEGDIGFASYKSVHGELMPIQKEKLRSVVGSQHDSLLDQGSMVSIGISYHDPIIDCIDSKMGNQPNYELWNKYALEYHRINQLLNQMSKNIAEKFNGIPLAATIGGMANKVSHVKDYFGMVISHRVVAENSGIGWRGKNQLIIHEKYSCAIRFASIIVPYPLKWGQKSESKCGVCSACEDVCSFIKNRDILPDYRENCRKYIGFLGSKGIEKDVCGKCIKACYKSGTFREVFSLPS
jgi:epoxyqueuosine reductase